MNWSLDYKDSVLVVATIAGPVLAVQAQKWVEIIRERRNRKLWVFHTLMATRAARVSPEHVQALNMIDLAFYGSRVFGILRRTKKEQTVLDCWKEYLNQLTMRFDEKDIGIWAAKGQELLINLLYAISLDLDYSFDRVQLQTPYSPIAHGDLETEQTLIRKLSLKLLSGEIPLKMEVVGIPVNQDALKAQIALHQNLAAMLQGNAAVKVRLDGNNSLEETKGRP
jgi:hypothetical protein